MENIFPVGKNLFPSTLRETQPRDRHSNASRLSFSHFNGEKLNVIFRQLMPHKHEGNNFVATRIRFAQNYSEFATHMFLQFLSFLGKLLEKSENSQQCLAK